MKTIDKVKNTIKAQKLVSPGDKVVVGISGGPDSTALLYILNTLRPDLGITLLAAHFNHKLRKGADRDQQFAINLSQKLHIPIAVSCANKKIWKAKGSLEELARQHRFNFLIRTAKKHKATIIALGHTQDDLTETVLMRILRGTGMAGMRAILPKRVIQGFTFIRPLLNLQKKEIINFLKKGNIAYRIDPSNKSRKFFRNKIRLQLLPLLEKEYNKNIKEILAHLANTMAIDYDFIEKHSQIIFSRLVKREGNSLIKIPLSKFFKLEPSLQRVIFRLGIEKLKGNLNRLTLAHMLEVEDLPNNRPVESTVHLPDKTSVRKNKDSLLLLRPPDHN